MLSGFRDLVFNLHLTVHLKIFLITEEGRPKAIVILRTVLISDCMKAAAKMSM